MKKLLLSSITFLFCLALSPTLCQQSVRAQKQGEQAKSKNCSAIKFTALNKYKGDEWSKVFTDRRVAPVLKSTLKNDYGKLKSSLAQADFPDSLTFVDNRGILTLQGAVPGLYTVMEAILIVEPCGNIYAAVLDQGERILYFTNDRQSIEKLPPAVETWRVDLEKRRRQSPSTEIVDLPVIFKNK